MTNEDRGAKSLRAEDIEAALLRAAKRARRLAAETGTPLVISRDGKVVYLKVALDGTETPWPEDEPFGGAGETVVRPDPPGR